MVKEGLFAFTLYILGTIAVMFFWRRSRGFFENQKLLFSLILTTINYVFSVFALIFSERLVSGK
jgi:hypothetical protein